VSSDAAAAAAAGGTQAMIVENLESQSVAAVLRF